MDDHCTQRMTCGHGAMKTHYGLKKRMPYRYRTLTFAEHQTATTVTTEMTELIADHKARYSFQV